MYHGLWCELVPVVRGRDLWAHVVKRWTVTQCPDTAPERVKIDVTDAASGILR